jgi:FKBP-type peptidyl-prolyl cis-trans isomerase
MPCLYGEKWIIFDPINHKKIRMRKIVLFGFLSFCIPGLVSAQTKSVKTPVKTSPAKTVPPKVVPTIQKAKGGLQYKVFPSVTKSALAKNGDIVKFHYSISIRDSVFFSSYDRVPGYVKVEPLAKPAYNLMDILTKMKKGDSAITIQMVDTLIKRGLQAPPRTKAGDKIVTSFRVLEIFAVDSIARADYSRENEKDRPRQEKEQEEQMALMKKARQQQQDEEDMRLEQSGEIARELKEIETYLATKNIKAEKTGKGTYVIIKEPGTGAAVEPGKFITVEYTGRYLATDSVFQSSTYTFQIGTGGVIRGWDEGLLLFKKGGSGTLYVPGFLAYGPKPPDGSPFKPFQALEFDVKIVDVKDQP